MGKLKMPHGVRRTAPRGQRGDLLETIQALLLLNSWQNQLLQSARRRIRELAPAAGIAKPPRATGRPADER